MITAVSDAIAVLPQFASEKDDDILVIDIASDRNRQPSDYDWNAFDNELMRTKKATRNTPPPPKISVPRAMFLTDNLEDSFGQTLSHRKRVRRVFQG